ncbi:MAG: NHL repeat-containing protein [Candidatus Omnitrophota bacterium]
MKRATPFIAIFLVILVFILLWSKKEKKPQELINLFSIDWEYKKKFAELKNLGAPVFWPSNLMFQQNYLYATEFMNDRIQVFMFQSDGGLLAKSLYGKTDIESLVFFILRGLTIKGNYLYVADSGNQRIQILKINPDGSLSAQFAFGKSGKGLGEFSAPTGLTIKGNYLYVADSGNQRIQVFEIK